ncbi:MAG: phosphoribosyl-AMP cyclohydrolase [Pseudomonadales bacterium]
MSALLDSIKWTDDGLIPAIAQDWQTGEILMMAWMNSDALSLTAELNRAVYWSRSRQQLWHKGESSGHVQIVKSIALDCDADVVVLKIEQLGDIACHTGRRSCFYRQWKNGAWETVSDVIKDPIEIYGK